MEEAQDRMLLVDEAADKLGLSAMTIYKWIGQRRIGFVRLGVRTVRIPLSEVNRLLSDGFRAARKKA